MTSHIDLPSLIRDRPKSFLGLYERRQRLQKQTRLSSARIRAISHTARVHAKQSLSLLALLNAYRYFEVSDPRDKFYSLHAIASDQDALPKPDYNLTIQQVRYQHLSYFTSSGQYPYLLSSCGLWRGSRYNTRALVAEADRATNLSPSWLPSWFPQINPSRLDQSSIPDDYEDRLFWVNFAIDEARGSSRQPATYSGEMHLGLNQDALSLDCARLCLRIFPLGILTATIALDVWSLNHLRGTDWSDAVDFLLEHVNLDLLDSVTHARTQVLPSGRRCCCPASLTSAAKHDDSCERLLHDYIDFEMALLNLAVKAGGTRESDSAPGPSVDGDGDGSDGISSEDGHKGTFGNKLDHCTHLAATSHGRFAFVPACAQRGDLLAIIPGLPAPSLLRNVETDTGMPEEGVGAAALDFQVVCGSVYVNGVMQGEVLGWPEWKDGFVPVTLV